MADTGIFATTAQVVLKVGANPNATAILEATINDFMYQVESRINVESEYNWSDDYDSLNVDVKGILTEAASNLAAIYCISYDPDSWVSKTVSNKLNILYTMYQDCIKMLREVDKGQIFIKNA